MELYTSEKPAVRRRALLSAIFLFAATSVLAAEMTCRRSADPLDARVHPEGWSVSYRPPAGYLAVAAASDQVSEYAYLGGEQADIRFSFYRIPADLAASPIEACTELVTAEGIGALRLRHSRAFGPFVAIEIADEAASVVARCAAAENGTIYAVSVRRGRGRIDRHLYRIFNRACESLIDHSTPQLRSPRRGQR